MREVHNSLPPEMAASIGLLAVLGTATADISATYDHVNQLRCGTAPEDPKINPRARAAAVAQFDE